MQHRTLPRHPVTGAAALGWRKARPGEDLACLYPVWPVLGGDGREEDEEEDQDGDDDAPGDDETDDDGQGDDGGQGDDDADPEGADALGDKGKRALASMKGKWRSERQKRRALEEQLANAGKRDDGDGPDAVKREAERAATAKANARILRSEVRAAAKGVLADPKDALTFLDLDAFEVDEDGEIDSDEIADAIEELISNKPYLAAAKAPRFQGTGDGGAARKAGKPKQLTREDLKRMSPAEIVKAKNEGRLDDALGINR